MQAKQNPYASCQVLNIMYVNRSCIIYLGQRKKK